MSKYLDFGEATIRIDQITAVSTDDRTLHVHVGTHGKVFTSTYATREAATAAKGELCIILHNYSVQERP